MNFYLVDKIGDGSKKNPFRPDVVVGSSYVCTEINNQFLVGTMDILDETKVIDLQLFCESNNLVYEDVLKWFVGD